jgi:hypothetical protein
VATSSPSIHIASDPGHHADRLRAYKVMLDGGEAGELRHGESLDLEVGPGRHEVFVKIDWGRSPTVVLDLGADEESTLACRPNGNPLTVLWYAMFGRKRYLRLGRA